MKVLQLIDSLNAGGAERMALNYYLALKDRNISSFLAVTREKGKLSQKIENDDHFYFLNKRNTFDLKALQRLTALILKENIEIVHAHGTSWFFAVLCKMSGVNFKLIWHDHYGNSEYLEKRATQPLKLFSRYFDSIISVNVLLKDWASQKLNFTRPLIFLPNFVRLTNSEPVQLKGNSAVKIICVANLRPQKDHYTLLFAFAQLQEKYSVSLHLIGRDPLDNYSGELKKKIEDMAEVYYYGETASAAPYLQSASLGVLSSKSEGLPLALIEYGLAGLPVVCTEVGQCKEVVGDHAYLVPAENPELLAEAIDYYVKDPEKAALDGDRLRKRINELYSETSILEQYLNFTSQL